MRLSASRFLILLTLMFTSIASNAQYIRGALIAGGNAAQVDGDEVFGYHKYGFQLGASAIIQFNEKWSVSLENIFNQKGAWQKARYSDGYYNLQLDYVEVPVLLQYTDRDRITVGTGFSWGKLVKVEELNKRDSSLLTEGTYNQNDWDILADLRFRLYKSLKLNIRYAYSLSKIATRNVKDSKSGNYNTRDQYNNLFSFRLMYIINEPKRVATEPRPSRNE